MVLELKTVAPSIGRFVSDRDHVRNSGDQLAATLKIVSFLPSKLETVMVSAVSLY